MNRKKPIKIDTPIKEKEINDLEAGDIVEITGNIYTARDSAHQKLLDKNNEELKFNLNGSAIYHCGPLMEKKDGEWRVVVAGPTTSTRLSSFIPQLLRKHDVKAMIGKGGLEQKAVQAMKKHKSIYLAFPGGCASLAADHIKKVEDVDWLDLGMPEAVWKLKVKNFPTTVAIDTKGKNLYKNK